MMKKLIIPLLLATVLLGGCHRVTVRHQVHLPPPVQVVEDLHVHSREVVVERHQGWQPPGHRHEHYSHQGPDRVVVVRPRPVLQTRVYSRPHPGYVVPLPPRRTYGYGGAALPRMTDRIMRHGHDKPPVQSEASGEGLKRASPQESFRQRGAIRDGSPYNQGDSGGGADHGDRGGDDGNDGNHGNHGQEHNGRDDDERAGSRGHQRGAGSQRSAYLKDKNYRDQADRERQQGEEKERGWGRGR